MAVSQTMNTFGKNICIQIQSHDLSVQLMTPVFFLSLFSPSPNFICLELKTKTFPILENGIKCSNQSQVKPDSYLSHR